MDFQSIITGHPLFTCAALAGLVALAGMVIDHRNQRRTNLDNVSLVSWGLVSSMALIVGVVCLAIGLRNGG